MSNQDIIVKIGRVGADIVREFDLKINPDAPIFFGESNARHIREKHPLVHQNYLEHIEDIINSPDYVGVNPKDQSLEYIKNFENVSVYIKVAVRNTQNDVYFARTMYEIKETTLYNYLSSGHIKQAKSE